jgi:hypothetical protein
VSARQATEVWKSTAFDSIASNSTVEDASSSADFFPARIRRHMTIGYADAKTALPKLPPSAAEVRHAAAGTTGLGPFSEK